MAKAQILIVEDDHDLREALVTTLELAKFRVREACNASEALERLAEAPVDMVVSDVNMPGLSGHQLLAEVQRLYPGLPMMLITAYGQISDAVSAMQAGAIDYLVKPFEPRFLVDAVSKVVGGGREKASDEPVAEERCVTVDMFLRQPVGDLFDLPGVGGGDLEIGVQKIRVCDLESDSVTLGEFFLPAFGDHIDLCGIALIRAVRPELRIVIENGLPDGTSLYRFGVRLPSK